MEVIGFPNYLIFKNGSILSKGNHRLNNNRFSKPRFLKHSNHTTGYKFIRLCKDGKVKSLLIHRLLALHFIPNPENKPTVDHINRIRDDNRLYNLRWATSKEQNNNQGEHKIRKDNKCRHKNVFKHTDNRKYGFRYKKKIKDNVITKSFKSLTDALCYKYIMILRMNANHF